MEGVDELDGVAGEAEGSDGVKAELSFRFIVNNAYGISELAVGVEQFIQDFDVKDQVEGRAQVEADVCGVHQLLALVLDGFFNFLHGLLLAQLSGQVS